MLRSVAVDTRHSLRQPALPDGARPGLRGDRRPLRLGHHRLRQRRDVVARLGREAIPDAEVRVDVAPPRRRLLELLAQLADEHVDRPVAARHRIAPRTLVDLLAREHPALCSGQQLEEIYQRVWGYAMARGDPSVYEIGR